MTRIDVHPVANIFPLLQGPAFEALVNDVRENGLWEPIMLHRDGRIIDGRNRYEACVLAQVEPRFETWDGDDANLVRYVVSMNLHRRHLDETQWSLVAGRIATLTHGGVRVGDRAANLPVATQAWAGELLNVSERSVKRPQGA